MAHLPGTHSDGYPPAVGTPAPGTRRDDGCDAAAYLEHSLTHMVWVPRPSLAALHLDLL